MRYILLSLLSILTGCINHNTIDISQFRPILIKQSPHAPTADELKSMRIVVLNIDHQINAFAKASNIGSAIAEELSTQLVEKRVIRVIKRLGEPTFFDEQRLFELVDKHHVKEENANYLITGKITQAKHNYISHKGRELRGGGSTDSVVSYSACVSGTINLFKLPSMQIEEVFPFHKCAYDGESIGRPDKNRDYTQLLPQTSPKIAKSIIPKITNHQYRFAHLFIFCKTINPCY
jgi:TolB-like protein